MPKTLADMTPEQRANCIGMWCEYPNICDRLGIIYALDDENDPWILRFDGDPTHRRWVGDWEETPND
ncbi:hypothetical protein [Corynebacterium striatum]|uniref:hypothetical protein n=1 Tax=Corynebacterium striatum TaxID=43770 RepID=UPI000D7593DC|nr:hypothetical protein [Corynebacterium striatum]PXY09170.1 hypothetical protein CKF53_00215 [Corynebacterium striatum]